MTNHDKIDFFDYDYATTKKTLCLPPPARSKFMARVLAFSHFFTAFILVVIATGYHTLSAGHISIHNMLPVPLYGRFYYFHSATGRAAGEVQLIKGQGYTTLEEPPTQFLATRMLALSPIKTGLTSHWIPERAELAVPLIPIGLGKERSYTIKRSTDTSPIELVPTSEWEALEQKRLARLAYEQSNPSYGTVAAVETTLLPHARDKSHIAERLATMPPGLRIGLCLSGGGFRAMTATIGLLRGLERTGLLSRVTIAAALSGSSWALAPWIASQQSIDAYDAGLSTRLLKGLLSAPYDEQKLTEAIRKERMLCDIPTSAIDFYGITLSHTLIKPLETVGEHTTYTLSSLAQSYNPALHPVPLFTAATQSNALDYHWIWATPWNVYGPTGHHVIPTWSFGRRFSHGVSIDNVPEPFLGYYLGIFGSSFSLSVRDMLERAPAFITETLRSIIPASSHESVLTSAWANKKFSPALVPNFLAHLPHAGAYQHAEYLCLVDGGYLNNIPLAPLLACAGSELDLIIILDVRREHHPRLHNMREAYNACARAGWNLPPLSDDAILETPVTLAHSNRSGTPSILYITLQSEGANSLFDPLNDRAYSTPQMSYTPEQYRQLSDFVAERMASCKQLITQLATTAH